MATKKHNIIPSKAFKTILGKIYIMIFVVVASIGTGFYVIQLNNLLQSVYQPIDSANIKNADLPPISQAIVDTFKPLHDSQDATTPELPSSSRNNPFN
jgi:predicted PurR-regulated permease PerM